MMNVILYVATWFALVCFFRLGWAVMQYNRRAQERKRGMQYLLKLESMKKKLRSG